MNMMMMMMMMIKSSQLRLGYVGW